MDVVGARRDRAARAAAWALAAGGGALGAAWYYYYHCCSAPPAPPPRPRPPGAPGRAPGAGGSSSAASGSGRGGGALGAFGWFTATAAGGEAAGTVARDLRDFLTGDAPANALPQSTRQLLKLLGSAEFVAGARRCVLGAGAAPPAGPGPAGAAFPAEGLVDKILSVKGAGFVSTVAGTVVREAVEVMLGRMESTPANGESSVLALAADPRGKAVLKDVVSTFVSNSVHIYLDKTMHINMFDQMLESAANPAHADVFTRTAGHVTDAAVRAWVQESNAYLARREGAPAGEAAAAGPRDLALHYAKQVALTPELRSLFLSSVRCASAEGARAVLDAYWPPVKRGPPGGGPTLFSVPLGPVLALAVLVALLAALAPHLQHLAAAGGFVGLAALTL